MVVRDVNASINRAKNLNRCSVSGAVFDSSTGSRPDLDLVIGLLYVPTYGVDVLRIVWCCTSGSVVVTVLCS